MSNFLQLLQSSTPDRPLGGRYQIVQELGVGGFGRTFLAEDLHLPGHPHCVIKHLHPQFQDGQSLQVARRLFDTEAQTLYRLGNHDQIPRLLAHFEDQQEFYLAQELIEGISLADELALQSWSESQAVAFLQDILTVLSFVHQQSVIHRDIKPSNLIRRDRDSKIVLIDFGAVKQVSTALANPDSSPTHTISIGTHGYMSNEQIAGNPRFCSDVYAVGVIVIQALTRVAPRQFEEDPRTSEILWRHRAPQVSLELADVLDRMVCYDFRTRYPTAVEALAAVENLPPANLRSSSSPLEDAIADRVDRAAQIAAGVTVPSAEPPASSSAKTESFYPPADTNQAQTPWSEAGLSRLPTAVVPPATRLKTNRLLAPAAGLAALGLLFSVVRLSMAPESVPPVANAPAVIASPPAANPDAEIANLLTQAEQSRQAEQYQQAIDRYDQAISLNPNSAEAQWGRCYSLNALQKPNEAIVACNAALAIDPDFAQAHWSKGYAFDQLQQHQEALNLYDQAIALKPDFAEVWSNKGATLLKLNRAEEAVAALDRAIELDPTLAEAWNNRGAALWSLRQFDGAIASIDRAIQLQPDYQDALNLRQQMRQRLGR